MCSKEGIEKLNPVFHIIGPIVGGEMQHKEFRENFNMSSNYNIFKKLENLGCKSFSLLHLTGNFL